MTDDNSEAVEAGRTVGARFVITALLGEGSQARTFEAIDKSNGRLVALKQFSVRGARQWKDVELAEREAEVLAALEHPLLPHYITHFEEDGALYLAIERIQGPTLAQLKERRQLSQADVLAFLGDAAQTLDYLHSRSPPIVHRDIKPSNVIRRPDGRYVLVDFGSVSHRLRPDGGSTVVGTFGYMAPEQFQGRAMPASDLYAAASTALSLVTGRDPETLPHKGLGIDVPRALGANFDPSLGALLSSALDPDPDKRSQLSLSGLLAQHGLDARSLGSRSSQAAPHDSDTPPPHSDQARHSWAPDSDRSPSSAPPMDSKKRGIDPDEVKPFAGRSARLWLSNPLIVLGALLGLGVARVWTGVVLLLLVPLLLSVLSTFFGQGLSRAARACRQAGWDTQRSLRLTAARIQATAGAGQARPRRRARRAHNHEQRPRTGAERLRVDERPDEPDAASISQQLDEFEQQLESAVDELEQKFTKPRS